jgi:predicted CoA-binding protein
VNREERRVVTRATIEDFLAQRSLALVGVSRDGRRGFGNAVRKDLGAKGYEIHLVHPEADVIAGQSCARSLREVAGRVGGVLLVTPPAATERVVREAADAGIRRVWMQQGAESAEAIRFCEEHGIAVVHGECVMMFAEPTGAFHGTHRWFRRVFRGLPR